jgi:uncharacterized protein YutE (UPF0331/DUF86 family)
LTDRILVLKKLSLMREHLSRVRRRRSAKREDFERDVDTQDATSLSFIVAVQEAADIALHIASDEGWGISGSYAESFQLLAQHGVIDAEQATALAAAAAVRNRIAHGYASLDAGRFWDELPAGLSALEQYARAIAAFAGSDT